jgi:hypothetical protein
VLEVALGVSVAAAVLAHREADAHAGSAVARVVRQDLLQELKATSEPHAFGKSAPSVRSMRKLPEQQTKISAHWSMRTTR